MVGELCTVYCGCGRIHDGYFITAYSCSAFGVRLWIRFGKIEIKRNLNLEYMVHGTKNTTVDDP